MHKFAWLPKLKVQIFKTILRPAHPKPEKYYNGDFTLKTHGMLSVHSTSEEFKNAAISGHFGFVFRENPGRKIT